MDQVTEEVKVEETPVVEEEVVAQTPVEGAAATEEVDSEAPSE